MNAMRFDAATSRRIESSYATPDVVEQRRAIIGALSLRPGERVLDRLLRASHPQAGGFKHNYQSVRVVDRLEKRYDDPGLNLTFNSAGDLVQSGNTTFGYANNKTGHRILQGVVKFPVRIKCATLSWNSRLVMGTTAAMHAALVARPTMPGFPSRAATPEERSTWRSAANARLEAALKVLDAAMVQTAQVCFNLSTRQRHA